MRKVTKIKIAFLLVLAVVFSGYIYLQGRTVRVTAYSPDPKQTDSTPREMASGRIANPEDLYRFRYCALSPDLVKSLGVNYGDKIVVWVKFELDFQDITNARMKKTVDVFTRWKMQAIGWGNLEGIIWRVIKKKVKKK